MKIVAKAENCV